MAGSVKKRIFYIDEIRSLAILCVILTHTSAIYRPFAYTSIKAAIPGLLNLLGYSGVPLFFMISGALLLNRQYDLADFFKRRFTRIFYPFIFWMIITLLISYFIMDVKPALLFRTFFGLKKYTWFIWEMIGIYLFLPVLNSFVREYQMKGVKYFLSLWLVVILLCTIGQYPLYKLELSYFGEFIGFLVLGYYLNNVELKLSDAKIMIASALLFLISNLGNLYLITNGMATKSAYLCIFTVATAVSIFMFIKTASEHYQKNPKSVFGKIHGKIETGIISKVILSISMCSYGMYFVNSLLFILYNPFAVKSIKILPIVFIAATVMSWIVVFALSRIPALKKFTGAA